jgi:hypothetical protein
MIDPKFFDDLAKKFTDSMPDSLKEMRTDFEKNLRAMMQSAFAKLDLVTREEFDIQVGVLARTREKLVAVEKKLTELEALLLLDTSKSKTPKTKTKEKKED